MPYSPSSAKIDPPLPAGSWDTHFHIFPPGPPLSSTPPFTPPRIPLSEAARFHEELGTPNRIMAHSFAFGYDQSSLEGWLKDGSVDESNKDYKDEGLRRALGVFTADATVEDIRRMDALGVRGVRATTSSADAKGKAEEIKAIFEKLHKAGVRWTVAVQEKPTPAVWDALLKVIDTLPTTQALMIDHLGFLPGPWGQSPPEYVDEAAVRNLPHVEAVLHLLERKNVYVKISAPYRVTSEYEAVEGLVKAMVAVAPERCVWASDWPFVPVPEQIQESKDRGEKELTFRTEDMPKWVRLLREWMGEEAFDRMMVENPAKLYAK